MMRRLAAALFFHTAMAHAQRFDVDRPRPETAREAPRAEETTSRPPASEPPPEGWYGAGAVVTDAAAAGFAAAAIGTHDGVWLIPTYASYLLGAPVNHLAHGQYEHASLSLALRLAPLLVSALTLAGALEELNDDEGEHGSCGAQCVLFYGSLFGGPVVVGALDDGLLARYPKPPPSRPALPSSLLSWSPVVTPRREGGLSLGVLGRF